MATGLAHQTALLHDASPARTWSGPSASQRVSGANPPRNPPCQWASVALQGPGGPPAGCICPAQI